MPVLPILPMAAARRRAAAALLPNMKGAVPLLRAMRWPMMPWLMQTGRMIMRGAVPLPSDREEAIAELLALSAAMAREGRRLIERVLPSPPATYTQWTHYPEGDAIAPDSKARWFYHAHPPEQRGTREHGHFHLFLPLSAFAGEHALATPTKESSAKVVHVAALCFDVDGLPTHWIATNHWVTEEYLHPAEAIIARLDQLDLSRAGEEQDLADIGRWLTLALLACRADIEALLRRRDEALAEADFRDKTAEILATTDFVI